MIMDGEGNDVTIDDVTLFKKMIRASVLLSCYIKLIMQACGAIEN